MPFKQLQKALQRPTLIRNDSLSKSFVQKLKIIAFVRICTKSFLVCGMISKFILPIWKTRTHKQKQNILLYNTTLLLMRANLVLMLVKGRLDLK